MYRTKCGGMILVSTNTALHLQAHPEVFDLLTEAIGQIKLPNDGSRLAVEVDLGRILGRSGCVATPVITNQTRATFAKRVNRPFPSRVAIGAVGLEISHVVIIAKPSDRPGVYDLITAYVGDLAPKEPWDPTLTTEVERAASLAFWTSHALVYDQTIMGPPIVSTWDAVLA